MYNGIVEDNFNVPPLTPEEEVLRTQAVEKFNKVMETKPSRQVIKKFLNDKAMAYLRQTSLQTLTRKQRRQAARQVSNRIAVKALAGEDIFDAGI